MKTTWNLAVIEPNHIVLEGLKRIFGRTQLRVVFECESIEGMWGLKDTDSEFAAILLDLTQHINTLHGDVERLRAEYPASRIVLLAEASANGDLQRAVQAGVDGLLLKSSQGKTIVKSMELILMGERVFPAELLQAPWSVPHEQSADEQALDQAVCNLSSREVEVLKILGDGSANKVIARRLGISEATVKVHVKAILRKTRAKNRTEAALWAKEVGLGLAESHSD